MITGGEIIAGWRTIKALYEKYQNWSVRSKKSKEAKLLLANAEVLMTKINRALLLGKSSDDPALAPLIKEFKELVAKDIKPEGSERTEDWISKSRYAPSVGSKALSLPAKAAAKPAVKKAAAKPAAKRMAAKPAAKKVAAKPAAKKMLAKPAAKKAAAKPATKKAAAKPAAKKAAAKA